MIVWVSPLVVIDGFLSLPFFKNYYCFNSSKKFLWMQIEVGKLSTVLACSFFFRLYRGKIFFPLALKRMKRVSEEIQGFIPGASPLLPPRYDLIDNISNRLPELHCEDFLSGKLQVDSCNHNIFGFPQTLRRGGIRLRIYNKRVVY